MLIEKANETLIVTKLCCHDATVKQFAYDHQARTLTIGLSQSAFANVQSIEFRDVLTFSMTGLEPWGYSPRVFSWNCVSKEQAAAMIDAVMGTLEGAETPDCSSAVFSELMFVSGDKLRVACGSIEVMCV